MIELRINNIYTRINKKKATKEEIDALSNLLSISVPGHYFSRAYRMGMWDGKKKFFHRLTGKFYTGLVGHVRKNLPNLEFSEYDERIVPDHQNNDLSLKGIELRPYQIQAAQEVIKKTRGIISAPPNSGKTEVAAAIVKGLGVKANFLTHRLNLLFQTKERFEERLGIKIGILGKGEKDLQDVNIMSVASLHKKLDDPEVLDVLKSFPLIIVDEVHHCSSTTFEKCLLASGAYWRVGLSATPLLRDDISNITVRGLTADPIVTVSNQELIDWGLSAFPSCYLFKVDVPVFKKHTPYDIAYQKSIVENTYRNSLIVSTAKKYVTAGSSVFIIIFRIQHGQILTEMLKSEGIDVEFISGEGSSPERNREVLKRFSEKQLPCIVSTSISDEGLDVPAVDLLILGVGDKSALKAVQRVGRGLRKKKYGDNVVTIVDFIDLNSPYLKRHSRSRLETYYKMGLALYEVVDENWENVVKVG